MPLQHYIKPNDVVSVIHQMPITMPPTGMMSGTPTQNIETLNALWNQTVGITPLLEHSLAYIHIPFCLNHCVFCGFYRNKWHEEHGTPYVDRLIAELAHDAEFRPKGGSIDALYFGGGTPTILSANDLSRLILAAKTYLPLAKDCEITVEGRMSHFDAPKIEACIKAGANRFSIGVQTFDTKIRKKLGRKHSGIDAAKYMRTLAAYPDVVVVLDLIYGLPGQVDTIWQNDIETALSLGLDGLDIYAFKCFPFLSINRMIEKGIIPSPQDTSSQGEHYAYAVHKLEESGFKQISNSHFASSKNERNIYNSQLKFGTPYIAFGSGGGGYHADYAYSGLGELKDYLATPPNLKPLGSLSQSAPSKQANEYIRGCIEMGYIDSTKLPQTKVIENLLKTWQGEHLLHLDPSNPFSTKRIELTIAGRYWGVALIRTLLQAIK